MKIKNILMGAVALFLTGSAFGQVTVDITGATAFRAATLDTIKARYVASGVAFKYAHDQAAGGFNGSTRSIWNGTFNGIPNVTIRCSFNGSVEGINAIVNSPASNPTYLDNPAAFVAATPAIGGTEVPSTSSPVIAAQSEAAFSDVSIASTPYVTDPEAPTDNPVGVVVFTMVANEGASANLTNITSQGFRALFGTGVQDLSILTGKSADAGNLVFATGRNDGSGTRTAYLAETGYGVAIPVNQYTVLTSTSTAITSIQRVPAGGVNDSDLITPGIQPYPGQLTTNKSTVWGQDIDGNGGYSSGSTLRGDMGKTATAVQVRAADYSVEIPSTPLTLVTWLSLNDALTARTNGAKVLGYDGVTLSDFALGGSTMSATDKAKVTSGHYAAWSFQQFFDRAVPALSANQASVVQHIRDNVPANLAAAGIPLGDMAVGRAGADGSTIQP